MKTPDDKHSDHDLRAYLDGRDGVSAAYRQSAQEVPPAALDQLVLEAARREVTPAAPSWPAARKPYALAASVMVAVVALSLYYGALDEVVSPPQPTALPRNEVRTIELPLEQAESGQGASAAGQELQPPVASTTPGTMAADAETADKAAADLTATVVTETFQTRELAPAAPTIGAGAVAPAPASSRESRREAFARRGDAPAVVIDGPLLERIEAEAAAATRQDDAAVSLEEIMVTGSRIVRRGDTSYRNSREDWLVVMRGKLRELQRSSRLVSAQRNTAVLESELNEEIALFLEQYPDADIETELGLPLSRQ